MFWQSDSEVRVHWKGAAEIVLASCTSYIDSDDHVVPLDENKVCTVIPRKRSIDSSCYFFLSTEGHVL